MIVRPIDPEAIESGSSPILVAIAMWLVDNTSMTFKQIGELCGLSTWEVQKIADDDSGGGPRGWNPILTCYLEKEEIKRYEGDPSLEAHSLLPIILKSSRKKKSKSYTPTARRRDKPDAICWLINNYPDMPDRLIIKLIGTTKRTIDSIRSQGHWNIGQIKPKDPVLLGLCTQSEMDAAILDTQIISERLRVMQNEEEFQNEERRVKEEETR